MNSLNRILQQNRKKNFVGRDKEIQFFKDLINEKEVSYLLLYIYGIGGQGKTSLLRALADICEENGTPFIFIDSRHLDADPQSFQEAFINNCPFCKENFLEEMVSYNKKIVLLIDSYEKINILDDWFRLHYLPKLPSNVLTVIAGRNDPTSNWKSDPAWRNLIKYISLSELTNTESKKLLSIRNIPDKYVTSIIQSTHGNPLALSIIADLFDQNPNENFYSIDSPNIVNLLLNHFIDDIPDSHHRTALELCCVVHTTTESLIQIICGSDKAHKLFDWLTTLTFIEKGPHGIYPHDIVREVILSELFWRNPTKFRFLLHKARRIYASRLLKETGPEQKLLLFNLTYLHRFNPSVRKFFEFDKIMSVWKDDLHQDDIPFLQELVNKYEGEKSLQCFLNWINHPAATIWVFRDLNNVIAGFTMKIEANKLKGHTHDPVMNKIIDYLKDENLKEEENCAVFRFWMSTENYQQVSNIPCTIFISIIQYLVQHGLALSMICCADPEYFHNIFEYAQVSREKKLDFYHEKKQFGFYVQDWRGINLVDWFSAMNPSDDKASSSIPKLPIKEHPLHSLTGHEFSIAIAEALKCLDNPKKLLKSPLLKCRFFIKDPSDQNDINLAIILTDAIIKNINRFEYSVKYQSYFRLLHRTYLNPVGSQLETADFLCLSFSTYRRQLKNAVQWIADILWIEEKRLCLNLEMN